MKVKSLLGNYNNIFIIRFVAASMLSIMIVYVSFACQKAMQDISGRLVLASVKCEKNILMMEWEGWYLSGKSPLLDKDNKYQKCK